MALITDNFDRPDGPLASPWTLPKGTIGVVSNQAQATALAATGNSFEAIALQETTASVHEVTVTMIDRAADTNYAGIVLASDATSANHIQVSSDLNGTFYAHRWNGSGFTNIIPNSSNAAFNPPNDVAIVVKATYDTKTGVLTVFVDGTQIAQGTDPAPIAGTFCGIGSNSLSTDFDSFSATTGPPANPLADLLLPTVPDLWAGLLTQNPRTVQDPLTIELISRIYSRPEARINEVWQDVLFPGIPAGSTVAALGLFDAPVNGNMRFVYVYDAPYVFAKGGYLQIPAANLALSI